MGCFNFSESCVRKPKLSTATLQNKVCYCLPKKKNTLLRGFLSSTGKCCIYSHRLKHPQLFFFFLICCITRGLVYASLLLGDLYPQARRALQAYWLHYAVSNLYLSNICINFTAAWAWKHMSFSTRDDCWIHPNPKWAGEEVRDSDHPDGDTCSQANGKFSWWDGYKC